VIHLHRKKKDDVNMDTKDIKTKREMYERKIEEMLQQFAKELPPEVSIESAVATRGMGKDNNVLRCGIKLVVEDLNK